MKSFVAALAFCTRIPVPASLVIGTEDVGRSARYFPLIGAMLGGAYLLLAWILHPFLAPLVIAAIALAVEASATGALHFDGLADMADGFGGGRTVEDVLRIMRDHAIGSYGGTALLLLMLIKAFALASLFEGPGGWWVVLLAPVMGRWSILLLSATTPYARPNVAVSRFIGKRDLVWGSLVCAAIAIPAGRWKGLLCWAAVLASSWMLRRYFRRRIGGVTGDTLGGTEEICEALTLVVGLALARA
jgi:cobalamin 5'-phosphate synthase/cobalamin synthase